MQDRKQTIETNSTGRGTPVRMPMDKPPSLQDIQLKFSDGIFDRGAEAVLRYIAGGKFSPDRHLQVYRNNVFASLTEALRAVYPVVECLVGENFFTFAAHQYIGQFPPRGGNLHDFGREFPDFLAAFEPAAHLVYLPDTGRLEWAYHEVYHAADAKPLSLESLASIPPAQYATLRFSLQPHARLIVSDYPILSIWQVNQPGYQGDDHVDLDKGGVRVQILRCNLEIVLYALDIGEYEFLKCFQEKATFTQACEAALAVEPDFDLTGVLQRHVRRGTIENVR